MSDIEMNDNIQESYFRSNSNIVITELNDLSKDDSIETSEYSVEEPYDYIFEPGHYKKTDTKSDSDDNHSNLDEKKQNFQKQSRSARMIGEKNGILEYEYTCFSDIKYNNDSNENESEHLNAIIRGISLTKCPNLGFGFSLAKYKTETDNFIYVDSIVEDSPAEFCLQFGDILIELDETNPCERFTCMEELNDYLSHKDSIHLMAIHESKYYALKSQNQDFLKNYGVNCEDIVIVHWNRAPQLIA